MAVPCRKVVGSGVHRSGAGQGCPVESRELEGGRQWACTKLKAGHSRPRDSGCQPLRLSALDVFED